MIHWDPSLSVGVAEIDAQHQAIIDLVNGLESKQGCEEPAVVAEALRFLRDYFDRHFAMEESLMRETGYPQLAEHAGQHELFVNNVIFFEIEKEFGLVTSQMIDDLLVFLTGWIVDHIANRDKALGEYLRGGG
ncbi:bacteriohemerythrin [Solidesulfovibrio sp.]|uniref:bacteriohemerythrin n=1 Tax=Solidesulfovibrio sp. TaxID=2910990 RepID=UPI002610252A|nr:bacteriohemerythrin [Solidesulfovibrio sp.]